MVSTARHMHMLQRRSGETGTPSRSTYARRRISCSNSRGIDMTSRRGELLAAHAARMRSCQPRFHLEAAAALLAPLKAALRGPCGRLTSLAPRLRHYCVGLLRDVLLRRGRLVPRAPHRVLGSHVAAGEHQVGCATEDRRCSQAGNPRWPTATAIAAAGLAGRLTIRAAATTSSSASTPRFPIRLRNKPIWSPCAAVKHEVRDSQGAGKAAQLASGSLCRLQPMWWRAVVSGGASGCHHRAAVVLTPQAIPLRYPNDTLFGGSLRALMYCRAIGDAQGARAMRT